MMHQCQQARKILQAFKGDRYIFGLGCLGRLGELTAPLGKHIALIAGGTNSEWGQQISTRALASLSAAGITLATPVIAGVRPNAPREDVYRLRDAIVDCRPEVVVVMGGGSTIDAAKAAAAMAVMGDTHPDIEEYFGVGRVSAMLNGKKMLPLLAVQLASSSAAHLTKYANITDLATGQKKLIIDDAIVPSRSLFDYEVTTSMSCDFTLDGALDGLSHALEVFYRPERGGTGESVAGGDAGDGFDYQAYQEGVHLPR